MSAVSSVVVAASLVAEGTQRISIRMLPSSHIGIAWGVALYEARRTARGALTWQMVRHLSGRLLGRNGAWRDAGCWTEAKAWRMAEQLSTRLGIPVIEGEGRLKHGLVIEAADAERYELVQLTDALGRCVNYDRITGRTILGLKRRAHLDGRATYIIKDIATDEIIAVGRADRGWRPPTQSVAA